MRLRAAWDLVRLTRPHFLLGGLLLYGLGLALALAQGSGLDLWRAALGQLLVTAVQLMTHYANEYYDLDGDRLNGRGRTLFSGGSGVLPEGRLPAPVALIAARVCALIAGALLVLIAAAEPAAAVIGTLALLGGWFYSAPPLRLAGSGWGEVAAALIVSVLTPLIGFELQTGRVDLAVLAAGGPLALVNWAMLIAFELPDYEADALSGKRTQTVRLGRGRASLLHAGLLALAVGLSAGLAIRWPAARVLAGAAPLAAWQALTVLARRRRGWADLAPITFGALSLFASTAALWLAGTLTASAY